MAEARQRARGGIGEVAGDSRDPSPIGPAGDAGDMNAPALEVDDEEHEVAHEASARENLHAEEVRGGDARTVGHRDDFPGPLSALSLSTFASGASGPFPDP